MTSRSGKGSDRARYKRLVVLGLLLLSAACSPPSIHFANDTDDNAGDPAVLHIDRLHRGVGRLEADAVLVRLGIPALERRLPFVGFGNDDLAGKGLRLFADHDV